MLSNLCFIKIFPKMHYLGALAMGIGGTQPNLLHNLSSVNNILHAKCQPCG